MIHLPEKNHLSLTNTARVALVALLLAVCAVAVAACGGEDVNKLIDQTFSANKQVNSGKVTVDLMVKAKGSPQLSQPVDLRLSGPFQTQGKGNLPKFDFALNLTTSGRTFNAGATSTGAAGFLKLQGTAYQISDQVFAAFRQGYQQAQSQANAQNGGKGSLTPASLGIDPRAWLKDASNEGDEDVAGTKATHVSAKIDVPKLLTDVNGALAKVRSQGLPQAGQLPSAITPAQQKKVADAVKNATFDFWTGTDDKILRKMQVKVDFEVPQAERASARGVTSGQLAFSLQLAELNQPQTISAPANPRPFTDLTSALGSLGVGGITGQSPNGAAPPSAAPPSFAPPPSGSTTP